MNKWKELFRKLVFPNPFVGFFLVNIAAFLLIYVFMEHKETEPAAYAAYMLSSYALVIICVRIPHWIKSVNTILHKNKYIHMYLTQKELRIWVSAYMGLILNLLFAVFKIVIGIIYDSAWLFAMAGYHTLSSFMVFILLYRERKGKDASEYTKKIRGLHSYELCGWLMVVMNTAISVIVFMVVFGRQTIVYPGFTIYVIAGFSFYCLIMGVINLIKYRHRNNPVFSAIKIISMAKALVSIFTLQAAMLTQFGSETEVYNTIMNFATGSAVCATIMALAVFMLLGVRKDYREVKVYGK